MAQQIALRTKGKAMFQNLFKKFIVINTKTEFASDNTICFTHKQCYAPKSDVQEKKIMEATEVH